MNRPLKCSSVVHRYSIPDEKKFRHHRIAVASEERVATGIHGSASEESHQNSHHPRHETVRSGASGCESGVHHGSRSTHEKPLPVREGLIHQSG